MKWVVRVVYYGTLGRMIYLSIRPEYTITQSSGSVIGIHCTSLAELIAGHDPSHTGIGSDLEANTQSWRRGKAESGRIHTNSSSSTATLAPLTGPGKISTSTVSFKAMCSEVCAESCGSTRKRPVARVAALHRTKEPRNRRLQSPLSVAVTPYSRPRMPRTGTLQPIRPSWTSLQMSMLTMRSSRNS